jgi:hypothetical protein
MRKPKVKTIRPSELVVDETIQRSLNEGRVRQITRDFMLHAVGTICVSHRDNGELVVIDGRHRTEAMKVLGLDSPVNAEVFEGLTLADEAALFRVRNNTEKVGFIDRFRVRLIEGDDIALGVQALAKKYGWGVVGHDPELPQLLSVRKLESIYRNDSVLAEWTLRIVTEAWNHDLDSVDHRILGGIDMFLRRYWGDVIPEEVAVKVAYKHHKPSDLVERAQQIYAIWRTSVQSGVAELATDAYNVNRRAGGPTKLASWR